jgi:threonine dehydrogenase-like Zn-dependent dehydrogenase
MRGTVLYGTGDIRFEDVPEPKITKPTDAIIRLAATCVCGSDLWSYRGISPVNQPTPMKPGMTVAVVGDGAVGPLAVLSAKQMGAERIIAMSRHEKRQKLALEFGATDIVTERGDEGVACIKDLTKDVGADAVLECVGTQESMMQAIRSSRPGGYVSYVGVPHGVELKEEELFFSHVHLHGGPAPVRHFLPKLIDLVWADEINPGKVFDLSLPLDQVAEGYRAMHERRAIKAILQP